MRWRKLLRAQWQEARDHEADASEGLAKRVQVAELKAQELAPMPVGGGAGAEAATLELTRSELEEHRRRADIAAEALWAQEHAALLADQLGSLAALGAPGRPSRLPLLMGVVTPGGARVSHEGDGGAGAPRPSGRDNA